MKRPDGRMGVRMSTRGRVTLPKALLARLEWSPGTVLVVEDTPRGVMLKRYLPETNEKVTGNDRP